MSLLDPVERRTELRSAGEPCVRLLGQTLLQDIAQVVGHTFDPEIGNWIQRDPSEKREEALLRGIAGKGWGTAEEREQRR